MVILIFCVYSIFFVVVTNTTYLLFTAVRTTYCTILTAPRLQVITAWENNEANGKATEATQ